MSTASFQASATSDPLPMRRPMRNFSADMMPRTATAITRTIRARLDGGGWWSPTARSAFQHTPMPPATRIRPTTKAASDSIRPWPYGWFSSAGLPATMRPTSTTADASTSPANSTPVAKHRRGLDVEPDADVQRGEQRAGGDAGERDRPADAHVPVDRGLHAHILSAVLEGPDEHAHVPDVRRRGNADGRAVGKRRGVGLVAGVRLREVAGGISFEPWRVKGWLVEPRRAGQ